MQFDKLTGRWSMLGAASEVRRSDERSVILDVLSEADAAISPSDLAAATGAKANNVKQLLFKMAKAGEVTKLKGRGQHFHPSRRDLLETNNFGNAITKGDTDEEE